MKEVNQILLDLKRKIYKPVYFLSGEEPHYIDQISDYIENNVLDDSEKEFNQSVVYGKEVDLVGILGLARQFPMMSEYNVVIVKEAQDLKELGKAPALESSKTKEKAAPSANSPQMQLQAYLASPLSSTILVFAYKYKTLDKRSALSKAIQKHSVYLETKRLYDNQIPDWISTYVKEKNQHINPKASFLLSEFLGNDLSKIANEINKLLINLPAGQEISPELVQNNIGISKDFNVFELQDAIGKRDVLRVNRITQYFAANEKENPAPLVLANLFGYFTKILRYQFLPDKSKSAAAQAMGVHPFFVEAYVTAARNYPTQKLKTIFSLLKEYDLKSKGVNNYGVTYGELMKELMYKILH